MSAVTSMRWVTLAAIVLVPFAMLFADRDVSGAMHGIGHPAVAVELTHLADVPLPLAGLALLAAGVAYLAGGRPGRGGRVVLVAAIATLVARAVCDELKIAFGRTWPETWVENNPSWIRDHTWLFHPFHGGRGYASFPSGHTTDIAAPAAVLWRCVPRWRWVAVVPVVLVAGGLVASDFHYVSDVLAGLYLGVVVAYGVSALIAT